MFDPKKTIDLIKGGLFDAEQTWKNYLEESDDWKKTAIVLTGPLILVSVLLSSILAWIFSSHYMFAPQGGLWATILGLVGAVIGICVAAFVFSFLAGLFKGKHDFNKGLAALSLAAIPGYLSGIVSTLPMIGWLIGIVLGIISLVFLYKIIPTYLEVPDDKRMVHYISSLIATIVIVFVINITLGIGAYSTGGFDSSNREGATDTNYGMFGEVGRQADLISQTENDRYVSPDDGQVTEQQMTVLLTTLKKTAEYRSSQEEKMKKLDEEMKSKKDFSFSDLGKLTSGMGSVMGTVNAEMEVVKSGAGNWAEHQWVKEQLRIASIQKDLNDAIKHNYKLYQKHAEALRQYGMM